MLSPLNIRHRIGMRRPAQLVSTRHPLERLGRNSRTGSMAHWNSPGLWRKVLALFYCSLAMVLAWLESQENANGTSYGFLGIRVKNQPRGQNFFCSTLSYKSMPGYTQTTEKAVAFVKGKGTQPVGSTQNKKQTKKEGSFIFLTICQWTPSFPWSVYSWTGVFQVW